MNLLKPYYNTTFNLSLKAASEDQPSQSSLDYSFLEESKNEEKQNKKDPDQDPGDKVIKVDDNDMDKISSLPPLAFRQSYRFWRVMPPTFGKTTGLTVVYEGQKGFKCYINTSSLLKIYTLFMNSVASTGKDTYGFQEINANFINRSVTYQKSRDPQAIPKITVRFIRINFESKQCALFQKVFNVETVATTGNFKLGTLLEQATILLTKEEFLDPYIHITESVDSLHINRLNREEPDDI